MTIISLAIIEAAGEGATYKSLVHGPIGSNTYNVAFNSNNENILSNDDVLLLPYSSGTTGVPKGVMITSGNLKAHILQIAIDEFKYYEPAVSGI